MKQPVLTDAMSASLISYFGPRLKENEAMSRYSVMGVGLVEADGFLDADFHGGLLYGISLCSSRCSQQDLQYFFSLTLM